MEIVIIIVYFVIGAIYSEYYERNIDPNHNLETEGRMVITLGWILLCLGDLAKKIGKFSYILFRFFNLLKEKFYKHPD